MVIRHWTTKERNSWASKTRIRKWHQFRTKRVPRWPILRSDLKRIFPRLTLACNLNIRAAWCSIDLSHQRSSSNLFTSNINNPDQSTISSRRALQRQFTRTKCNSSNCIIRTRRLLTATQQVLAPVPDHSRNSARIKNKLVSCSMTLMERSRVAFKRKTSSELQDLSTFSMKTKITRKVSSLMATCIKTSFNSKKWPSTIPMSSNRASTLSITEEKDPILWMNLKITIITFIVFFC